MREQTRRLAEEVRKHRDSTAQLAVLKDAFAGGRCAIVTCGPSLGDFEEAALQRALEGSAVIAVKQAIDVVGDAADFLCFNAYNVSRYRALTGDDPCAARRPRPSASRS